MKKYIIPTASILMVASTTLFAAVTYFTYSVGTPLSDGVFRSDGSGNAGAVNMQSTYLDGDRLKGSIDIQSIGLGIFDSNAKILPPTSGNPTRNCWTVEGTITSPNAGTVRLSGPDTELRFNPVSRKLEGYGYNNGLGRIPLGEGTACGDGIIEDGELVDSVATTSAGFVGRVKILGNAGGNTVFDSFYGQGVKFNASLFNTTLQRIRKNVGLLTRNLSDSQKNGTLVGDKKFYIKSGITKISDISVTELGSTRSIILIGGDFIIDSDISNPTSMPKGIIVLRDNDGNGGNIYVTNGVKRIDAVMFAEGSIYSGESEVQKYNDTPSEIVSLPERQLYIVGALISRNTIGGASKSATEVLCPYNEVCTFESATQYDLNYFRGFQASGSTDPNRAYKDVTLDDYSVIIEIDTRAISDPPPGLE